MDHESQKEREAALRPANVETFSVLVAAVMRVVAEEEQSASERASERASEPSSEPAFERSGAALRDRLKAALAPLWLVQDDFHTFQPCVQGLIVVAAELGRSAGTGRSTSSGGASSASEGARISRALADVLNDICAPIVDAATERRRKNAVKNAERLTGRSPSNVAPPPHVAPVIGAKPVRTKDTVALRAMRDFMQRV